METGGDDERTGDGGMRMGEEGVGERGKCKVEGVEEGASESGLGCFGMACVLITQNKWRDACQQIERGIYISLTKVP